MRRAEEVRTEAKAEGKEKCELRKQESLEGARSLEIGGRRTVGKSTKRGKTEPTAWGERKRETGWTQAKAGVKREERTKAGTWKRENEE